MTVETATGSGPDRYPEELLAAYHQAMHKAKTRARPPNDITPTPPDGGADAYAPGHPEMGIMIEAADAVVHELFAVGLTLASCASMTRGHPVADRLIEAIDRLDTVIHDLRTAVVFG